MTAKEVLRQHLHGFSDEQFEIEISKFPLNECLFAMDDYKNTDLAGAQWQRSQMDKWVKVGDVKVIIGEVLKRAAENGCYYTMRDTSSDVENAILNTIFDDLLPQSSQKDKEE